MLLSADPGRRIQQWEELRELLKTWPVRPGRPLSGPLRMLLYTVSGISAEVAFSATYIEGTPRLFGKNWINTINGWDEMFW